MTIPFRPFVAPSVALLLATSACDPRTEAPSQPVEKEVFDQETPAQDQEPGTASRQEPGGKTRSAPPQAEARQELPETENPKQTSATEPQLLDTSEPFVKRLVIAEGVEKREPIELTEASTGMPVVAFVELKNETEIDTSVVITFEHESGKKVGFIELSVPAESPRYRTWGRTKNIQDAGTWSAVVRTKEGKELARQSFAVRS